ncbi:hypothetical protein Sste5344_006404 [Sporothrix stenoceras]
MQACDRCHSRKTKCDRRIPQCSACEKAGVPCLHADKLRQRNIPRGYIDNMENLVAQLREENQNLRRDLQEAQEREQTRSQQHEQQTSTGGLNKRQRASSPDIATISSPSVLDDIAQGQRSTSVTTRAQTEDTPPSSTSPSGSTRALDPFTLEVGYLTLTATGEGRYLGPSSGIDLASIISTVVSAQSGINNMNMIGSGGNSGDGNTSGKAVTSVHVNQTIPSDVRSLFPSLSHAMPYIESYFQHTHKTFPLLHRPSFLAMAERVFTDTGFYAANPYDAFVFDMVLSIGSSNINRFGESASGISSKCLAMGQSKIQPVMEMGGMASLRAILLICHHGIFSSHCDTSASIWHLVGIGARLIIELGLHLKQRRFNDSVPGAPGIVIFEEEMRRRCFWCLYNLDRVVSFTLGRPVVIRDEEVNTPLPSPQDDSCFGPDRPIILSPGTDNSDASKTSPFLHVLHIRRTSGQILGMFYNARNLDDVPMEERRRVRREFEVWLQKWQRDTENLKLSNDDGQTFGTCFTSPEWYTAVYNNAILLLYRPSPYMPHLTRAADTEGEMPDLLKLFNAGRNCIMAYSELHNKRRLNYSWITMHGIFIAGLSFIYSVGRILQDPGMREDVPDFLTVVDVTRACSNILAVICERWNVSRRSCELFNKLSNAVIKDTLHAMVRRDSRTATKNSALVEMTSTETATAQIMLQTTPGSDEHEQYLQQDHHDRREDNNQPLSRPYDPLLAAAGPTTAPPFDDMLVMDEFRQFSETLDTTTNAQNAYPSEMVFGFLQDWPFDMPFDSPTTAMGNTMGIRS